MDQWGPVLIYLCHMDRGGERLRERERGGVIKKSPTKALYEYTKGEKKKWGG